MGSEYFLMSNQIVKDAFRQILWRVISALGGFITIKLITPFLGPLRYGDYNTVLKYFAIRSALADLGLYTIALRELGKMKSQLIENITGNKQKKLGIEQKEEVLHSIELDPESTAKLSNYYSKFMGSRLINLVIVYVLALWVAYLIPSYSSNPFIVWGLPLGMIFSATFVLGYFFQLPHQLFWSMQHTSISLIIARVGQIALLAIILYVFPHTEITASTPQNILIFCLILATVIASGLFQIARQWWTGRRYLHLKLDLDRGFFKKHITDNWKYGIGYFMSSFHTLAVGLLLSWFYPTTAGYYFVWVWWLSMTLVEILLIVPSSLGNSALHKISHKTDVEKRTSIGSLMSLIWTVWGLVALNFYRFSDIIITFVSGTKYLSSTLWWIWSDIILWFLGIVLLLTFTKQVFNYMFIATDHQNKLFSVNTRWVIFWIGFASRAVYHFGLVGGIAGQLFVEALYVIGAIWIAYRNKVMPIINKKIIWLTIAWVAGWCLLAYGLHYYQVFWTNQFINLTIIWVYNILLFGSIFKLTKKIMRGI